MVHQMLVLIKKSSSLFIGDHKFMAGFFFRLRHLEVSPVA